MADGPVGLTFKGGKDFDEPWLVLSGTTEEIQAELYKLEALAPGIQNIAKGVLERIVSVQRVGPAAAEQILQQQPAAPTAPVAPAAQTPTAPVAPVVPISAAPSALPPLMGPVMAPTPGHDYPQGAQFGHQCQKCGVTTYLQAAGFNKARGEAYDAYWRCPNAKNHPKRSS